MSEDIKLKTYKEATRIATLVKTGKPISESDKTAVMHFIFADHIHRRREAIADILRTLEQGGFDMRKAKEIYDDYIHRKQPMESFLLRLQDGVL